MLCILNGITEYFLSFLKVFLKQVRIRSVSYLYSSLCSPIGFYKVLFLFLPLSLIITSMIMLSVLLSLFLYVISVLFGMLRPKITRSDLIEGPDIS